MATYSRVLLSGSAVGGYEELPSDNTYKTVHQVSTTSGTIDDVTVEITNFSGSSQTVTVRLEQNGTLKHSFTKTVASGATEKVLDQITLAHNMDVKVNWVEGTSNALAPSHHYLVQGERVSSDLATETATTFTGPYILGVDEVNGYLFTSNWSGTVYIHSIVTGEELGSATGFPSTIYGFSCAPNHKKAIVYGSSRAKLFDYSDPSSFTATNFHSNLTSGAVAAVATDDSIMVWYGPGGAFYRYEWGNEDANSTPVGGWTSLPNTADIVMVGNPLGAGWVAFPRNNGSYYAYSGNRTTTTYLSGVNTTYIGGAAFKPSASEETFWLVGTANNPVIRKYSIGSASPTSSYTGDTSCCWTSATTGAVYGVDETGDERLFYVGGGSTYARSFNITDNTHVTSTTSVSISGFSVYIGDLENYGLSAPVFSGFANRQTP